VAGFAGARPLVSAGEGGDTKKIPRDDVIEIDPDSGLISIMGGKWTTHRAMAEDTINAAQKAFGVPVTESPTRAHVLYGGEGFTGDLWEKLAATFPISKETGHHLASKFGTAAWEVLELTKQTRGLAEAILPGSAPIQAEVIYSIRHELAATPEDILARRLGVQFFSWRAAIRSAPVVASLMAQELQWSNEQAKSETAKYVGKINGFLERAGLEPETVSDMTASRAPAT
jgi:glycerol-3-phosphate dehydrogenase